MFRFWSGTVLRYPSALLLLVQLGGVLLYPWMDNSAGGRALFGIFGIIVLGLSLRMVQRSPALTWIAGVLAVLVMALSLANAFVISTTLALLTASLEAAFYFYAAGSMIAYMLQDERASTDDMYAAGATFTLLAWAFAYLFTACQIVSPAAFIDEPALNGTRSWMDLLFLSFSVLSSVGLSDIMPLTPFARALVMLEAFAGVMYIALVVSRLIGLTTMRNMQRSKGD